MPISTAIKGLQNIKSMQNIAKSGISNKDESDFIKLYLIEKERTRLKNEETRILQRLEIIQARLNEIQQFYNEKTEEMKNPETQESNQEKSDWKTMSMGY
jgi:hypothetical protein